MEVGLSQDTVQMIEDRLGPQWARRALWGVTVTMIISPILLAASLMGVFVGLFLGVWSWTFGEVSAWAGLSLGATILGGFGAAMIYWGFTFLLKSPVEKSLGSAKTLLDESRSALADARRAKNETDLLLVEVRQLADKAEDRPKDVRPE